MEDTKTNPLRQMRRTFGLSQDKIARDLGISLYHYRKWEKEPGKTPMTVALALTRYFNVTLCELFSRENT